MPVSRSDHHLLCDLWHRILPSVVSSTHNAITFWNEVFFWILQVHKWLASCYRWIHFRCSKMNLNTSLSSTANGGPLWEICSKLNQCAANDDRDWNWLLLDLSQTCPLGWLSRIRMWGEKQLKPPPRYQDQCVAIRANDWSHELQTPSTERVTKPTLVFSAGSFSVWLWIKIVVALWFSPTNIAPQPIPLRSASRTLGKVQSFTKRTSSKIEIGSHGPFSSMIYLSKNGGSFHSEVFTKGSAWGWPGWRKIPWISMMFSIGVFLVNLHNHNYQLFQCELEMPLVFLPDAAQKI